MTNGEAQDDRGGAQDDKGGTCLFNAAYNQRAPKTWSGSAAEHQWGRKLLECALMAKRLQAIK